MGFQTEQLVNYIVNTFELPMKPSELSDLLSEKYKELFPQTQLLPGDYQSIN